MRLWEESASGQGQQGRHKEGSEDNRPQVEEGFAEQSKDGGGFDAGMTWSACCLGRVGLGEP